METTEQTPLTEPEIAELLALYPRLPGDYLDYLRALGWGNAPSGHMIYSGPIAVSEVYPFLADDSSRLLIGDDNQGYCLAYDFEQKCYGEFSDSGHWSAFDSEFSLRKHLMEIG